jgi:hypothetical protein
MAVPETLNSPFASTKIVRPGTWIVARSRDARSHATLRACRRRGERTSDRCHRDERSKCLLHKRRSSHATGSGCAATSSLAELGGGILGPTTFSIGRTGFQLRVSLFGRIIWNSYRQPETVEFWIASHQLQLTMVLYWETSPQTGAGSA